MTDTFSPVVIHSCAFFRVIEIQPGYHVTEVVRGVNAMGVMTWDRPRSFYQWLDLAKSLSYFNPRYTEHQNGESPRPALVLYNLRTDSSHPAGLVRVVMQSPWNNGLLVEYCDSLNVIGEQLWFPLKKNHRSKNHGIRILRDLVDAMLREFIIQETP